MPQETDPLEDFELSFPRRVLLRLTVVFIELVTRTADVLLLLIRPRLLVPYLSLWLREVLASPYRLRRSFELVRVLKASALSYVELIYGETPLATGVWLLRRAGLRPGSRLVDLGAGRGRVLLAARWLGAEARGLELLETNVALAEGPVRRAGASLAVGDAAHAELSDATHVYTTWTALLPETKARFIERFRTCRPGTRIITVTRPVEAPGFVLLSRHRLLFTWGYEPAFIHEYRPEP